MVYYAGRSLHAKFPSIIHNGQWRWPRLRNRFTQFIVAQTPPNLLPDESKADTVRWLGPDQLGRPLEPKIRGRQWNRVVWYGKTVPRWSFILWLAMQNPLSTKD